MVRAYRILGNLGGEVCKTYLFPGRFAVAKARGGFHYITDKDVLETWLSEVCRAIYAGKTIDTAEFDAEKLTELELALANFDEKSGVRIMRNLFRE